MQGTLPISGTKANKSLFKLRGECCCRATIRAQVVRGDPMG